MRERQRRELEGTSDDAMTVSLGALHIQSGRIQSIDNMYREFYYEVAQ